MTTAIQRFPPRMVAEVMVGDLQRIMAYPKLGYQTEQLVSDEVHFILI